MSPHMLEYLTPSQSHCLGRIRVWLLEVGRCRGWGVEVSSASQFSLALVWRALPLTPTPCLPCWWTETEKNSCLPDILSQWQYWHRGTAPPTPRPMEVHSRKSNRQSHVLPRTRKCSNWRQCPKPKDWVLLDAHLKQRDVLGGFLNYIKDTDESLKQLNQGLQENQPWIIGRQNRVHGDRIHVSRREHSLLNR